MKLCTSSEGRAVIESKSDAVSQGIRKYKTDHVPINTVLVTFETIAIEIRSIHSNEGIVSDESCEGVAEFVEPQFPLQDLPIRRDFDTALA